WGTLLRDALRRPAHGRGSGAGVPPFRLAIATQPTVSLTSRYWYGSTSPNRPGKAAKASPGGDSDGPGDGLDVGSPDGLGVGPPDGLGAGDGEGWGVSRPDPIRGAAPSATGDV